MAEQFDYKEFRSSQHVRVFQESVKEWFDQWVDSYADPFHTGNRDDYLTWYSSNSSHDDLLSDVLTNSAAPIFLGMFNLILRTGLKSVGSPIEMMMYLALCLMALVDGDGLIVQPAFEDETEKIGIQKYPTSIIFTIQPQVEIRNYRIDFLISAKVDDTIKGIRHKGSSKLIVECDGHEFHEKTKQQVSRDKKRDRDLVSWGYKVFRFSGTDVYNDPIFCANEVINHVRREAWSKARLPKNIEYPIFRFYKTDKN